MEFSKEFTIFQTPKGILIPNSALKMSRIASSEKAKLHLMDNVIAVTKGRMTAMELLTVVEQLRIMANGLLDHLSQVCGSCTDCESDGNRYCPYNDLDSEPVGINSYLIQDAGIPEGTKLCAEVDRENHQIIVSEADHQYDLRDLPVDLVDAFAEAGICLGKLEEHLMVEDTIYGGL